MVTRAVSGPALGFCRPGSITSTGKPLRKDFAAENVDSLIEFAKANGGIEYAEARMKEYHDKAVDVLLRLPESVARTSLIQLADYIMTRSK